ncbi:MAG: T9SS type A sorting domain-containing protein [Flavobacteriales bacterium]|nr:T9SS type A sorting domain-containing protein [Flavobacteriales bacterium]
MRRCYFILLLCSIAFAANAQIPNSGMELWSEAPQLIHWQTNSYPLTLPPYDPYIVRQDTDAHGGQYAANFYGNGVLKPWATTTFAIGTAHPAQFNFWYRVSFAPCVNDEGFPEQDTVSIDVELLLNGDVVDQGHWESTVPQMDYEAESVLLSQNATEFDSCRITIRGGKVYGGCGIIAAPTEFRVDDLSLTYPSGSCIDPEQIDPEMGCLEIYDPVCGCDNVTYSNACYAEFHGGVTSWTLGECGTCVATFGHTSSATTVSFTDQTESTVTSHSWDFGDASGTSTEPNPTYTYSHWGWYEVCLTITGHDDDGNACTDMVCHPVYATDGCVDSSLICPPWGLCCDAPLLDTVCGCNGITYMNPCVATYFGGVLETTPGPCDSIPIRMDLRVIGQVSLMPNPAKDKAVLMVDVLQRATLVVTVRNLLGQEMSSTMVPQRDQGQQRIELETAHLPAGIYLVELRTDGRLRTVQKLMKQ